MDKYHNSPEHGNASFSDSPLGLSTLPPCDWDNVTGAGNSSSNLTAQPYYMEVLPYFMVTCYILICILGLAGNILVIYVVLIFAKMKTVTNMYILNLAFSDLLFLIILPVLATTTLLKHWIFGFAICKIYYVLFSINLFGGAFNLCVMSADRYLAVCHPIRSLKYRTSRIALFLCLCIWSLSFVAMLPIILYSSTAPHGKLEGKVSCQILWPSNPQIQGEKAFIWYSFILGFALPVSLISVFYVLVILRLRHVGPAKKSKEKRKSHRRVTRLVLTVIAIYVVCWLPYWCFQVHLVFRDYKTPPHMIVVFSGFTVLSYANSMLNPFLYAFLSDNFRKSFAKAFKCISSPEINKTSVCNENSVFPRTSQTYTRNGVSGSAESERMELSAMDSSVGAVGYPPLLEQNSSKSLTDEQGFLKPPVQL